VTLRHGGATGPIHLVGALRPAEPAAEPHERLTPTLSDDASLPVSARVRARIQRARHRFHANDNISAFLKPGELEALLDEVEEKMRGVLESLVIDTVSDHNTQDTAAASRRCT